MMLLSTSKRALKIQNRKLTQNKMQKFKMQKVKHNHDVLYQSFCSDKNICMNYIPDILQSNFKLKLKYGLLKT